MPTKSKNWFAHYANAGMSVLPIKTDGTKAPAVSSWNLYRSKIATDAELTEWHEGGFGVGLVGGKVSGGLEVIDIDDPSLARPFYAALKNEDPGLVNMVSWVTTPRKDQETGLNGVHILYRCDDPKGNQKLAMSEPLPQFHENGEPVVNVVSGEQTKKPETLIETRGEGGYVLTVGCPNACHPSGNLYEQKAGCEIAELQKITPEQRATLHRIAASFDRSVALSHQQLPMERDAESPGNKFAAVTSWEEILEPHGWIKVGGGNPQHWRRPGKNIGTSATTGLVSNQGAELFCVFTTSAHPFPGPQAGGNCSTHSKFDAYARLNFNSDHHEAAKHLVRQGHGSEPADIPADKKKPIVFMTWAEATRDYIKSLSVGKCTLLSTGLDGLDRMIGGLAFGELCIIGGRPSHGKTLVALQLADYFAQVGHSSLLISEEMSKPMLGKRRLHMASELDDEYWYRNWEQLASDHDDYTKMRDPVYIAPQCGSVKRAVEVIDKAATEHELKIVIVDYAQLLRGKGSTRYEQVTDVSQQLREATSRHALLTIMLCQLNRGSERNDSRPRSFDLRDSGQLEQDADVVLLVDWPKMRGDKSKKWDDYLIYCEKNRNREVKAQECNFQIVPRRQFIQDVSPEWEPEPSGYDQFAT